MRSPDDEGDLATLSQQTWLDVRRYLNSHRFELSSSAAGLHADRHMVRGLVVAEDWVVDAPIPLGDVQLGWSEVSPAPALDGTGPESAAVRPFESVAKRHDSYAEALGHLDPPRLFENRPCYRLLDLSRGGGGVRLTLGHGMYFEIVNICEAVAHEFAAVARDPGSGTPDMSALPFRSSIGDVLDLSRRPAIPAISVLTIRRSPSGGSSFVLHRRDATKVVHAGGLFQVMPVGVFQPSGPAEWNHPNDFDLWRSIVREYSEEFLGEAERSGVDGPIDYDSWPFYRDLTSARQAGRLNIYLLGFGIDPLSLVADLLMVAVFDADLFDAVFGDIVATNDEGEVISHQAEGSGAAGIPFTEAAVEHFSQNEPMQAAGAATLHLAWHHRAALLPR